MPAFHQIRHRKREKSSLEFRTYPGIFRWNSIDKKNHARLTGMVRNPEWKKLCLIINGCANAVFQTGLWA